MRAFLLHEETEEAETRRRFGLPVDKTYISRIKKYFQKKQYVDGAFMPGDSFSEPEAITSFKGKAANHRKTITSTKRSNSSSPKRITKNYSINDAISTPKRNRIVSPKQRKSASSKCSGFRKALELRPDYGRVVLRRLSDIDTTLKVLSDEITSLGDKAKQNTSKLGDAAIKLAQTDQDVQFLTTTTDDLRERMDKLTQIIPRYHSNLVLNSPVFYSFSVDDEGYSSD